MRYPPTNLSQATRHGIRFSTQGITDACNTRFRYARVRLVPPRRYTYQLSSFKVIGWQRLIVERRSPVSRRGGDRLCERACTPRDLTAKQHRLPAINRTLSGFFHLGTQPRFMAGLHPASLTVPIETFAAGTVWIDHAYKVSLSSYFVQLIDTAFEQFFYAYAYSTLRKINDKISVKDIFCICVGDLFDFNTRNCPLNY